MGATGSADNIDPSNIVLNPGQAPSYQGATSSFMYAPLSLPNVESSLKSIFVAAAGRAHTSGQFVLQGIVGTLFKREDFDIAPGSGVRDDMYQLFVGCGAGTKHLVFEVGSAVKWYSTVLSSDNRVYTPLFDIGGSVSSNELRRLGYAFQASGGLSHMNIGEPVHDLLLGEVDAIEMWRWGVSITCSKPPHEHAVSPISVAVNFDSDSEAEYDRSRRYLTGCEVAVMECVLFRAGYVHDDLFVNGARDATAGAGFKFRSQNWQGSMDYAFYPYYHNKYGGAFSIAIVYRP
jgi:hypothetical protein